MGRLRARIVGGVDREGGGDGKVVVLLHGYGAGGDDLVPLFRVLDVPRATRFVFPEAPILLGSYGGDESRAWWPLDLARLEAAQRSGMGREAHDEYPSELPEARAKVIEFLDVLDGCLAPSSIVLGGFSQGAMLALDVALHCDRPFESLALLSATLLAEGEWVPRMKARAGLRVLQTHGTHDPLLAFSGAEKLRDRMIAEGLDVRFVSFRGGHEIPNSALTELETLVR